jgi:flagellar biosynthesis chaperone FliJ
MRVHNSCNYKPDLMAFRFSLESVLRLRRSEKRQQELMLQKMNEQANRLQVHLEECEQAIRQLKCGTPDEITGAEFHFEEQRRTVLELQRMEIAKRVLRAREQQAFAAQQFKEAWRRCEAIECLETHERKQYLSDADRRAQFSQDDLFLQRQRRNR